MAVVTEAVKIMKRSPDVSKLEALRVGMNVLPEIKRRRIRDSQQARWAEPIFEQLSRTAGTRLARKTPRPEDPFLPFPPASNPSAEPPSEMPSDAPVADTVSKTRRKPDRILRWKDHERLLVVKGMFKIKGESPDLPDHSALKRSMEVNLPADRQRHIATIATEWPWINKFKDEALELLSIERAQDAAKLQAQDAERLAREDELKQRAAAEQAEREQATLAARRFEQEKWDAAHEAVELYKQHTPLEELLVLVAQRAASSMLGSLVETLQTQVVASLVGSIARVPVSLNLPGQEPVSMEGNSAVVKLAPKERKPRVLVVGLLNQPQNEFKRSHGELVDFSFVSGDSQHTPDLEDKARHVDLIISCGKFMSHSVINKLRKVNSNIRHEPGALSGARRFLTAWLNGEVALAV
jgi:hypothetical protein